MWPTVYMPHPNTATYHVPHLLIVHAHVIGDGLHRVHDGSEHGLLLHGHDAARRAVGRVSGGRAGVAPPVHGVRLVHGGLEGQKQASTPAPNNAQALTYNKGGLIYSSGSQTLFFTQSPLCSKSFLWEASYVWLYLSMHNFRRDNNSLNKFQAWIHNQDRILSNRFLSWQ